MDNEKSKLEAPQKQLEIPVVMHRFNEFINEYEKNIAKEKAFLSSLDPIETCDDILYELQIRRDALKKCYEYVFRNGA
jgi:flagellar biosynthesis chaperone FliJ